MKWEGMDGFERSRQFKRLRELFFEALDKTWNEDFAEYQTVFEPLMPDAIDNNKVHSGYGKTMQSIPDGEWSLICALRGGKTDGM